MASKAAAVSLTTRLCPPVEKLAPRAANEVACAALTLWLPARTSWPDSACTATGKASRLAALSVMISAWPAVEKPGAAARLCAWAALIVASALSCVAPSSARLPDSASRSDAVSETVRVWPLAATPTVSRKAMNCASLTVPPALSAKPLAWP